LRHLQRHHASFALQDIGQQLQQPLAHLVILEQLLLNPIHHRACRVPTPRSIHNLLPRCAPKHFLLPFILCG
jgi:hypothetical protein